MSIIVQRDATVYSFIIFLQTALHVSGDTFTHHLEHTQTVLVITSGTGRTVFATVRWRGGVGTGSDSTATADGSKYGPTTARCCNYSLRVLLMMDESITRNMKSCLQKYNKTVYSRILLDNYWQNDYKFTSRQKYVNMHTNETYTQL